MLGISHQPETKGRFLTVKRLHFYQKSHSDIQQLLLYPCLGQFQRELLLCLVSTFTSKLCHYLLKTLGLVGRPTSVNIHGFLCNFHYANNSSEPARKHISIEEVRFTGSPAFDLDNNYFVPHPDPIQYVGEPSPEIDRAWEKLTWGTIARSKTIDQNANRALGRYILITKEEAVATLADTFGDVEQFWSPKRGGYIGGFDMFHTLHCLVRKFIQSFVHSVLTEFYRTA